MFTQRAGVGVALGAAGDLTGVRFLRGRETVPVTLWYGHDAWEGFVQMCETKIQLATYSDTPSET